MTLEGGALQTLGNCFMAFIPVFQFPVPEGIAERAVMTRPVGAMGAFRQNIAAGEKHTENESPKNCSFPSSHGFILLDNSSK